MKNKNGKKIDEYTRAWSELQGDGSINVREALEYAGFNVDKRETVDLSAVISYGKYADLAQEFAQEICRACDATVTFAEGDELQVNYKFNIEYLDKIESRLEMWMRLIDCGLEVSINFESLTKYKLKSLLIVKFIDTLLEAFDSGLAKETNQND